MSNQNQYFPQSLPHPGETLEEKLQEMGMGPKEFAIRTGKPEKTIIAVMKGDSAITPDMAVQFESVTRIPAHFWIINQRHYDEYIAREKRHEILKQSAQWARLFPLSELIKKGWIPESANMEEKTMHLLKFFGMSSPAAWENYYFNRELKVAFSISLKQIREPYAISAWLRKGEIQAAKLTANTYSEKRFKEALPEIKELMSIQPEGFFNELQNICLKVGVKVVCTPDLPKTSITGSTRWLNKIPLIQLGEKLIQNDDFCASFFHQAGHILLHGKKDIFLEKIEYPDKTMDKELEASTFARKWTLPYEGDKETALLASEPIPKGYDV
ncbi:MAG: XRE family transcriptional regulator [Paludibacter sp.]|nr:XRE family transcriptional regulator [Paludibacter sp.]